MANQTAAVKTSMANQTAVVKTKDVEKSYDDVFTEIRKTNDYSKFKIMKGNRSINKGNYKKLLQSMSEEQLVVPVLINEKNELIDGQHRYNVAKALKLPIYYYVVKGYDIKEVQKANQVSLNWGMSEYQKHFIDLDCKPYIDLMKLMTANKITLTLMLEIIAVTDDKSSTNLRNEFKKGLFKIKNKAKLDDFLKKLEDFNKFKEYKSTTFIRAFLRIYREPDYIHDDMKKKLEKLSYKIQSRGEIRGYISLLMNEIYNIGKKKGSLAYDYGTSRFYTIK